MRLCTRTRQVLPPPFGPFRLLTFFLSFNSPPSPSFPALGSLPSPFRFVSCQPRLADVLETFEKRGWVLVLVPAVPNLSTFLFSLPSPKSFLTFVHAPIPYFSQAGAGSFDKNQLYPRACPWYTYCPHVFEIPCLLLQNLFVITPFHSVPSICILSRNFGTLPPVFSYATFSPSLVW